MRGSSFGLAQMGSRLVVANCRIRFCLIFLACASSYARKGGKRARSLLHPSPSLHPFKEEGTLVRVTLV